MCISGLIVYVPQLSQQQLQNVSSEKEGMRQHFEAQQGRRKVPTPPSGQQHSQAMSPQPAQRDLPRPATSADPPSIAEKQSTVTSDEAVLDSPVPPMSETNQENTSLNTTSLASLYRDPSVKWGKQRAVSPVHSDSGSSWHGDSCRSPV